MSAFERLGREANTDKVTHHGYQRFFPQWLDPLRATATGILEIGIEQNLSVNLWLKYFEKAFIYGIDISFDYNEDRVKIIKADQSSIDDLKRVLTQIIHPVNAIIDDGSHVPEHQILTFSFLFLNLLEEGGVYIVEDIETSYWKRGGLYGYNTNYGYKHPKSFVEYAKKLVDVLNNEFLNRENRAELKEIDDKLFNSISSITFGQNCVIIKKKTSSEMQYNNREYLFGHFI